MNSSYEEKLYSNQKVVGYSHDACAAIVSGVRSSHYSLQGSQLGEADNCLLPSIACIAPAGTLKARQQG